MTYDLILNLTQNRNKKMLLHHHDVMHLPISHYFRYPIHCEILP